MFFTLSFYDRLIGEELKISLMAFAGSFGLNYDLFVSEIT